ncbi:hypothetical protein [Mesorhizobium sp. B2-4-17]|uniref:hypothetical protein n=1 Tax=Mesorhizobium sp. B2-4-17 TaxID=2589932 RepID=UPI0011299595|nr:hypothetical protein [Mesorhizobium sp. B2-4-17]TPK78221.1 hypothetical protein FJ548_25140 [Mesorhizobium sp. B2-4-17]
MLTEKEAKAAILTEMAVVDAVRQRIDALREVRLHSAGAAGLMAVMAEADSVLAAAYEAFDRVIDVLSRVPMGPLKRDMRQHETWAVHQLGRARVTIAAVVGALVSVAVDLGYDAERTQRRADVELARIMLERGRAAAQAVADMQIIGLTRPPKGWARSCAKRLSALRQLEVCEAA